MAIGYETVVNSRMVCIVKHVTFVLYILNDSTNPGNCFIGKDGNNRDIQTKEVSVGARRI